MRSKLLFVQQHIGILKVAIEALLNLAYTPHGAFKVAIPREDDKGGVGPACCCISVYIDSRWCVDIGITKQVS